MGLSRKGVVVFSTACRAADAQGYTFVDGGWSIYWAAVEAELRAPVRK